MLEAIPTSSCSIWSIARLGRLTKKEGKKHLALARGGGKEGVVGVSEKKKLEKKKEEE